MTTNDKVSAIAGPPLLVGLTALLLHLLPTEAVNFLVVWTLTSVPVGMLIGHCSLKE
ncbi:hypothetical protein [Rhodopila sp.]|uniref:hypothetical protein n=1 Tax=Rhodopila sp. TaxID=2480087 RepID=UPI003D0EBAF1